MDLSLEFRHAFRSLKRHRTLTLAAAVTLGLGIGAALTMAGIIEHVLLRPAEAVPAFGRAHLCDRVVRRGHAGRHDEIVERAHALDALHDALEHRLAADRHQNLGGQARAAGAGLQDRDDA